MTNASENPRAEPGNQLGMGVTTPTSGQLRLKYELRFKHAPDYDPLKPVWREVFNDLCQLSDGEITPRWVNTEDFAHLSGYKAKTIAHYCNGGKLEHCARKTGGGGGGRYLIQVAEGMKALNLDTKEGSNAT